MHVYLSFAVEPSNPWSTPQSAGQQSSPWGSPSLQQQQQQGAADPPAFDPFSSPPTNGTSGNNIDDAFDMLSSRTSPAVMSSTTGQSLAMFDPLAGTMALHA